MTRAVLVEEVEQEGRRIAERAVEDWDIPSEHKQILKIVYTHAWASGFLDATQEAAFKAVGERFKNCNSLKGYAEEIDAYMRRLARRASRERVKFDELEDSGSLDSVYEDLRRKFKDDLF